MKQTTKLEDDANIFACLFLMPKEMIEKDLEAGIDLRDGKFFIDLAKKYSVPLNALIFRIILLKTNKI